MGCIEGRVAIEYLEPEQEARKFAFKCHRRKVRSRPLPLRVGGWGGGWGALVAGRWDEPALVTL